MNPTTRYSAVDASDQDITNTKSGHYSTGHVSKSRSPAEAVVKPMQPFDDEIDSSHEPAFYWWSPARMIILLVLGIAFAVIHHLYYNNLQDQEVSSVSEQEWATRYGTALAFLVKTCFVAAAAGAYGEYIWVVLKRRAITVAGIDAVFGATNDLISLFSIELYKKVTLGALLALVTWLLPLTALVTPATLSVVPYVKMVNSTMKVPVLNLSDSNVGGNRDELYYGMKTPILQRMFMTTYAGASILSMPAVFPQAPNSTYEADFNGPVVSCRSANNTETEIMSQVVSTTQLYFKAKRGSASVQYLLVPPSQYFFDKDGAANSTFNHTKFAQDCVVGGKKNTQICSGNSKKMFANGLFWTYNDGNTWTCFPYNATLHATFETGLLGRQVIRIAEDKTKFSALTTAKDADDRSTYNLIFGNFNDLLSGAVVLSIAKAGEQKDGSNKTVYMERTSIDQTALFGALNLSKTFDTLSPDSDPADPYVTSADIALTRNRTLDLLIQDLSLNLTLSFFSMKQFWTTPQYSTDLYTPVNTTKYSYNSRNLFLSYGIALIVSVIAVLIGGWALWSNGVSYSSSFSGILQSTRNPWLDGVVLADPRRCLGSLPLEKRLAETKLQFGVVDAFGSGSRRSGLDAGVGGRVGFGRPEDVVPLTR